MRVETKWWSPWSPAQVTFALRWETVEVDRTPMPIWLTRIGVYRPGEPTKVACSPEASRSSCHCRARSGTTSTKSRGSKVYWILAPGQNGLPRADDDHALGAVIGLVLGASRGGAQP
jgi:hypothetical protein